jgi:hypothetical protein
MVIGAMAILASCTGQEARNNAGAALPAATVEAPAALVAGTPAEMMQAAAEACIVEFRDMNVAIATFQAAGWEPLRIADLDSYEVGKDRVGGYVDVAGGGCRFESGEVSLDEAKAIGANLMNRYFPDSSQPGPPEGTAGVCDGFTAFPNRGLVVVAYDGLGQDPICPDPNGSSILISTSSS